MRLVSKIRHMTFNYHYQKDKVTGFHSLCDIAIQSPIFMYIVCVCVCVCMCVKQKHPGCKKVRGQSEATLQTGMCDQNSDIS